MRSITYLITGKPRNRSDCFDYHENKSKAVSVGLELAQAELVGDVRVVFHLFGVVHWVFEDGTEVEYEDLYGGVLHHESDKRRQKSVDNANRRMNEIITSMESRLPFKVDRKQNKVSFCDPYEKVSVAAR